MKDAQRRVAEFVHAHDLSAGVETRLLDLVSEKGTDYGSVAMLPGSEWSSEMGDLLYSLIALANETGVDLETSLDSTLAKYRARIAERGDPGSDPSS